MDEESQKSIKFSWTCASLNDAPQGYKGLRGMTIVLEVAPGELFDKISILEIKLEKIRDEVKLADGRCEYEILTGILQNKSFKPTNSPA